VDAVGAAHHDRIFFFFRAPFDDLDDLFVDRIVERFVGAHPVRSATASAVVLAANQSGWSTPGTTSAARASKSGAAAAAATGAGAGAGTRAASCCWAGCFRFAGRNVVEGISDSGIMYLAKGSSPSVSKGEERKEADLLLETGSLPTTSSEIGDKAVLEVISAS